MSMKTIGLIGGMSWESTLEYYRIINEAVKERLGGLHSAKIMLYSVDFAEIETLQHAGQWETLTDLMIDAATRVERGGADCVLIGTNTMHLMAEEVARNIGVPLLHIGDATAEAVKQRGITQVALLGTKFTMEKDFYREKLAGQGLDVTIPPLEQRDAMHRIIYEELCRGIIRKSSREYFLDAIGGMAAAGTEGIILGCTEIGLLIKDGDAAVPFFDTTDIHARSAVDYALA